MGKKHPFNHFEFRTRDSNKLQSFYGTLFGWKFSDGGPGYTMISTGNDEVGAGIMQLGPDMASAKPGLSGYIHVKSLEDTEARIRELGGNVLASKQEVPGMGHFSVFVDVDGNQMGVWQEL